MMSSANYPRSVMAVATLVLATLRDTHSPHPEGEPLCPRFARHADKLRERLEGPIATAYSA